MHEQPKEAGQDKFTVAGAHAILGLDIVSFSTLRDDDQLAVIKKLMRFIREALAYHSIADDAYRWSPAGDGGYLTFITDTSCHTAIDVAFSIFEKLSPAGNRVGLPGQFNIRAALHAGVITEDSDITRGSNIWGIGINTTSRILSISEPSQLLVSQQYFDAYLKGQREREFQVGEPYSRTVKHGVRVEVMNVGRTGVCLRGDEATDKRWKYVGSLWRKTVEEYEFLIGDAMRSAEPVAAIAAAKFLLELGEQGRAQELCKMLSHHEPNPQCDYPPQSHELFSSMPADVLLEVIRQTNPRVVHAGDVICQDGIPADICFFPVAGSMVMEVAGCDLAPAIKKGAIFGEISLWVPNLIRTATIRASDVGLVLELSHRDFCRILEKHSEVAEIVYGMIKRRIIESVWNSSELFPGLASELDNSFSSLAARCEKLKVGETLDLSAHAYVLLTGRVRIAAFNGKIAEIVGERRFDRLVTVGILSRIGMPDGDTGDVIEETVAVKISHVVLADLQKKYPSIARAWSALCGQRLDEMGFSVGTDIRIRRQGVISKTESA
jgi:class 3 adenylate cyclase/CRP-like cAMP-binding protein